MSFLTSLVRFVRGTSDYPRGNPGQAEAGQNPDIRSSGTQIPGISITADTAITISAVFRAVHLVSSTIASFPIDVIEKRPDGTRLPVSYLSDACIWDQPNHEMSQVEFWAIAGGHILLNGNAFLYVQAEEQGYSFWPIEPERVEVARLKDGRKAYRVDGDKVYYDFRAGGTIIHITGWSRDGLLGVSPVRSMATALGLAKATEEYASRYFANGTSISGILVTDQPLTPEEAKYLKGSWNEAHQQGLRTAHEVAVLSSGLKWQSAGSNPQESQMEDVRKFQVAEIARMFGVPEHLIGSHDKTSSWGQGLEINNRAFIQFSLMPHLQRIEQAINNQFLRVVNDDLRYPRAMKFNVGALMRGTSAERAQFYKEMFQMGVYTVNMILAFEDLPGIGPMGDVRFVPGNNLVPLDSMLAEDAAPGKAANGALQKIRELLEQMEAA